MSAIAPSPPRTWTMTGPAGSSVPGLTSIEKSPARIWPPGRIREVSRLGGGTDGRDQVNAAARRPGLQAVRQAGDRAGVPWQVDDHDVPAHPVRVLDG